MTEQLSIVVNQFDLARQDIERWRGGCLDLFSRCEAAVIDALREARACKLSVKLDHLAGQRMTELLELNESRPATTRQSKAFHTAYTEWRDIELKRSYLAHGVASESIDREGAWVAMLDIVLCEKGADRPHRWTVTMSEATKFETRLRAGLAKFKGEIGHLKKRLAA